MTEAIQYTPAGPVVDRFHLSDASIRVLMGPLGSGKTTACCFEVLVKAMQQKPNKAGVRRTRWLVVRNTYPELISTTINSWNQWFGRGLGEFKYAPPITHKWRFDVGDGTRVESDVIFMALDGPDADAKIRGLEITGAWLNECREIAKPIWDMLDGRIGRFPPKNQGGPTWTGIIADTNMPDDDHFLYKFAEVDTPETWQFFKQPGGVKKAGDKWALNPNAENLKNLPEGYYNRQVHGKNNDWVRVYLAAEYGYVSDGRAVFPEYSDTDHSVDLEPIEGLPIHVGADWGLTPAAVIMQQTPTGQILVLDEVVSTDVGAARFAQTLKRFIATKYAGFTISTLTGDPAGEKRAQTDEMTVFQIMHAEGLKFKPAPLPSNDQVLRREAVARPLTRFIDGKPGLMVDRKCQVLRAGLSGKYCYKRMKVHGERYHDTPDKNEYSHVVEALEYGCLGLGEGRNVLQPAENTRAERPNVITGTKRVHLTAKRGTRHHGLRRW